MAMVVNETKLNAAMTATADAIRAKTGDSAQIPFDYENGKGFADAVEAIPQGGEGDPYEKMIELMTGNLEYFKTSATNIKYIACAQPDCYQNRLKFFSITNNTAGSYTIRQFQSSSCRYYNLGKVSKRLASYAFAGCASVKSIVFSGKTLFPLQDKNVFTLSSIERGTGYVYFPDKDENGNDLPSQFKSASNWSTYATQIKGFSEAPAYDSSTTYEIGDVCKYNGKFYGYCKEDLTSSTGNAPSGTTSDNAYWEYVDEIEV